MRLAIIFLILTTALAACGGPTREAQAALTTTAVALRAADEAVAPGYEAAAARARTETSTWSEYDHALEGWNAAELALRTAHAALLTSQAGLDAWRAGDQGGWFAAVPCLVAAIDRLRVLLDGLGVRLTALSEALTIAAPFAGSCGASPSEER
jgi:hypothetical protein